MDHKEGQMVKALPRNKSVETLENYEYLPLSPKTIGSIPGSLTGDPPSKSAEGIGEYIAYVTEEFVAVITP